VVGWRRPSTSRSPWRRATAAACVERNASRVTAAAAHQSRFDRQPRRTVPPPQPQRTILTIIIISQQQQTNVFLSRGKIEYRVNDRFNRNDIYCHGPVELCCSASCDGRTDFTAHWRVAITTATTTTDDVHIVTTIILNYTFKLTTVTYHRRRTTDSWRDEFYAHRSQTTTRHRRQNADAATLSPPTPSSHLPQPKTVGHTRAPCTCRCAGESRRVRSGTTDGRRATRLNALFTRTFSSVVEWTPCPRGHGVVPVSWVANFLLDLLCRSSRLITLSEFLALITLPRHSTVRTRNINTNITWYSLWHLLGLYLCILWYFFILSFMMFHFEYIQTWIKSYEVP